MKNRKFSSNTLPKKWKNQHRAVWIAQKQKKRQGNIGKGSFKYNRPKTPIVSKLNRGQQKWKLPGILFLISIFSIILVIPTLIVVPFVSSNQQESSTIENGVEKGIEEDFQADDSSLSVAVMRAKTEEVENVPLETYVQGVVASEMYVEFEMEALKAQALAARTFIVNRMLSDSSFVSDTEQDQVFRNEEELRKAWGKDYDSNMKKVKEAVASTKGKILTYNDAPIFPAFFSTSNGFTENSEDYWDNELPYLRSVQSPWDEESPKFLDQKTFTIQEVEHALQIDLKDTENIEMETSRTAGHRVSQLKLGGNSFTGREVREKLKLQSSDFTIKQKNNHLIFTTKGFGHGIGMSQFGANGMAKEGKTYEEIVKYYYKGVEISTVTDTAPTLVSK